MQDWSFRSAIAASTVPLEHDATASTLAKNLQAGRLALVSRARPPVNPSDTVISGTMFTPFCWDRNANRP